MNEKKHVVLDTGASTTKIGWSHQSIPQATYASVVGRPLLRNQAEVEGITIKDVMIGEEALRARAVLELSYPLQ